MIIFLLTVLSGIVLIASAYPILNLIEKANPSNDKRAFSLFFFLPIGYIAIQIYYFYGHLWFSGSTNALIFTACFIITLFLISFIYKPSLNKGIWEKSKGDKKDFFFVALIPILFVYINWPWLSIGEGHYFHSSNEDFYEGITGGIPYLTNLIKDMNPGHTTHIRFQYSSIGFWSQVLQKEGMFVFLFQASLNLLILSTGTFWLSKNVFKLPNTISFLASIFILLSCFFFNTYLTGHIGSTIYASYAPTYLGILILLIQKRISFLWIIPAITISIFSNYTYPQAARILEIPFFIMLFYQCIIEHFNLDKKLLSHIKNNKDGSNKINTQNAIITFILFSLIGSSIFYYFWSSWSHNRASAMYGTGSWEISIYPEIIPIFWGLFQPNLVGANSLRPFLIKNPVIYYSGFLFSFFSFAIFLYGGYKSLISKEKRFLVFYAMLYPLMALSFRFVYGKPYYFYKVLYVNYFLIIIIFITGAYYSITSKNSILKTSSTITCIILFFSNIFWISYHQKNIFERPYHNVKEISTFLNEAKNKGIKSIQLRVPKEEDLIPIQTIIKKHSKLKIDHKSNHFVNYTNLQNLFQDSTAPAITVFSNQTLALTKEKREAALLQIRDASHLIQNAANIPIYWTRRIPAEANNVIKKWHSIFSFSIENIHVKHNYISILLCTGPGINFKNIPYQIQLNGINVSEGYTNSSVTPISFRLNKNKPNQCNIKILTKDIYSKSIMPLNPNRLSVAIAGIEISEKDKNDSDFIKERSSKVKDAIEGLKFTNLTLKSLFTRISAEFISASVIENNTLADIRLGNEWYPMEQNDKYEYFKRAGKASSIYINNLKDNMNVYIILEPENSGNISFTLTYPGSKIEYHTLNERTKFTLDTRKLDLNDRNYKIQLNAENPKEIKLIKLIVE